ncbi:iron complex outermembrane recepter protein [Fontimonas thermophila]|uniref:Iron complex outermembrane recepter protein n=2 Tax=Fontimonas thermophila TaxID=1076937 RepID=A0A1I2HQE2_9GAMM|nr:iron complex outermembrane recepter protein [Fontimonas thermophila]
MLGASASLALVTAAFAQNLQPTPLEPITVTATRLPVSSFEIPASISLVTAQPALSEGTLTAQLSEILDQVPGLVARDRQNYAQDTQIAIRGFGARSTFGIRGIRLYLDGIPASQPDGQGQIAHFDLASADRVEVLRGPFSTLYGNSSGGVIQMFTADPPPQGSEILTSLAAGSFETYRASAGARGTLGPAGYVFNYTHLATEGFRSHSRARRDLLNAKLVWASSPDHRFSLIVNHFAMPHAEDPLGLTRAQFDENPRQATTAARQFDTRKSVDQTQGGLIYEWQGRDHHTVRALAYAGARQVRQFLAIPVAPQANPKHPGGVIDLDNRFAGADLRWGFHGTLSARPYSFVAGLAYETLTQARRGYENFDGDRTGVQGVLRRDETNTVYSLDPYAQADWQFSERASLMAGLRHSRVRLDFDDHYVTDDNGDDSGARDYFASTAAAGVLLKVNDDLRIHTSYGIGFETPTLAELAYRPDGEPGPNLALNAARSRHAEVGAKLRLATSAQAQLALFHADTRDEVAICANSGGRSAFCNAGRTQRLGAEAHLVLPVSQVGQLELSHTWLRAVVREGYLTCTSTPCAMPSIEVAAGNRLPGVPESKTDLLLRWGAQTGWHAQVEAQYLSKVYVNDVNDEAAPSYALVHVGAGYVFPGPGTRLRLFVQANNLFDAAYAGSVIVNDANRRYYEPGPGFNVFCGLSLHWQR